MGLLDLDGFKTVVGDLEGGPYREEPHSRLVEFIALDQGEYSGKSPKGRAHHEHHASPALIVVDRYRPWAGDGPGA